MNRKLLLALTCALALAFLGCPPKTETATSTADAAGGEILVGEYGSLTGGQATFGTSTHTAIVLAIDEINSAGGVNGRKIKVITEDDQSKSDEAANAVT